MFRRVFVYPVVIPVCVLCRSISCAKRVLKFRVGLTVPDSAVLCLAFKDQ